MSTAFREAGSLAVRPWTVLERWAVASRHASRRRHAALAGARVFAQAQIGALDRESNHGDGLRIASIFALGATEALGRAVGLDARNRRLVEIQTLGWLCGRGRLGAWRLRRALWREALAPDGAELLAAGRAALHGWLRGESPGPRLEALLQQGLQRHAPAAQPAAEPVTRAAQG
jgi:hypothetical protein